MLDLSIIGQIIQTGLVLYVSLAIIPLWYLVPYLLSPLRQYPGPFLAGRSFFYLLLLNITLIPITFISDTFVF